MNRIPLNNSTFGDEEITAAIDVLRSSRMTMGHRCAAFERAFGEYMGGQEAVFVNSGSSANLLSFFALANFAAPQTANKRKFFTGCEVIVPAVSWSTTFWPIVQAGCTPVLVDSDPQTFQMRTDAMRAAVTEKTVAICPVHVLGNTVQMDEVLRLADRHELWIVEDTCEALGARFRSGLTGTFGDMATFSFFFSHHITTIEGGMIVTKNTELAELLRCMRAHGWTRDLRRRNEIEKQYPDIDNNFLFVNLGFNLRPIEINAALGLIQLKRLAQFNRRRNEIASIWNRRFLRLIEQEVFHPMRPTDQAEVANFGYAIICRSLEVRKTLKRHLQDRGVETRPIICGNIARQPVFAHIRHRISGDLSGANEIMDRGLFWGLHPLMSDADVDYVSDTVLELATRL